MATIDKDLLLDKIDRLLKLHSYAREDWFANTIHNTVWDAPEIETGGETIYRADAIKAVIDAYVMDAIYEVISEDIIKALSALPSAEAVQGWIPCSERLPEIDETLHPCDQISEEVLGTDTYGNIRHVYLTKCGYLKPTFCTVEEGMSVDIVAWMPLPKPYKGGDSE